LIARPRLRSASLGRARARARVRLRLRLRLRLRVRVRVRVRVRLRLRATCEPGERGLARLDGGERLLERGQVDGHACELHAR